MSPEYQQKYQERQKALEEIYAPQIQGLQQQITTLPQQYEAQKSALQQAKENAFRDITKTASRGGMFFTGFTPREEARYLGEKYLPGLQQLSAQELAARQGLLGQIASIQGQQKAAGLSYLDQLAAMQRADEEAARSRAAASSAGFSIPGLGDLGLGADLGAGTTAGRTNVQQSQQAMLNKGTADNYAKLMKSKNTTNIKNELNFLLKQMTDPNVPAPIKQTINNQYQIFLALAKEYNVDLNKLGPSRAQAIMQQPVINRLTLTPSEYINQVKTNINAVKNAYNWMFGAR